MSVSRKVTARVTAESCCDTGISSAASCATIAASSRRRSGPGSTPSSSASSDACPLISAKGFTLPAGAVEGEHQLAPTPLAQRRVGDRGLEIADDLRGATRREQRIGAILHERGMALDPARLLGCAPLAIGQFRDTAPESQRLVKASHRLAGVPGGDGVAAHFRGRFVARGINLGCGQGPARSLRQHEAVAQSASQSGDVGLKGFFGSARWIITPQEFHERVGRHDGTAVQPEHREDGAGFGARDRDRQAILPDLQRPQNPQLHLLKRNHLAIVIRAIQRGVKIE